MHRLMNKIRHSRLARVITGLIIIGVTATACMSNTPSGASQDTTRNVNAYNQMVANQPAHTMTYSPTRNTINFWIDTWNRPGALSYVYIQNAAGKLINHYVFKGLPVSYCAALTPTQRTTDPNGDGNAVVNNPSLDGVYYSGGQCNEYYGEDATSGAYVEYSLGIGQNQLLFSKPLPQSNVPSFLPSK